MGLFNCLYPRTIVNGHGEIVRVRCGHCNACLNQKGSIMTTQCKLESASHRYCMFVTLTYRDSDMPLVQCYHNRYTNTNCFYPITKRLKKHVEAAGRGPFYDYAKDIKSYPDRSYYLGNYFCYDSLPLYYEKFELKGCPPSSIPVLDRRDVQDFLKRLRYYLATIKNPITGKLQTNEKIRYYACGEYGPVHFRPHYHLLLWFDDVETFRIMGQAISKSWRFGRIDFSLSRGLTSSYVANYISGLSNISRLHSLRHFSPFCLHSTFLFGDVYKHEEEEIYEYEYERFVGKTYSDNGKIKSVPSLLAFESRFFQRCLNYGETDSRGRFVLYTFLSRAYQEYGERPISELSQLIMADECGFCHALLEQYSFDGFFNENTIKSVLYCSKKFYKNSEKYQIPPRLLVSKIEKYWSDKNYYNLCRQLQSQCDYCSDPDADRLYLLFWYDNYFHLGDDNFSLTPPAVDYVRSLNIEPLFVDKDTLNIESFDQYKDFVFLQNKISNDRVKHKKLNDLNKIFCK